MPKAPCIDHGRTKSLKPEGYALVRIPGVRSRCTGLHRLVYAEKLGVPLAEIPGVVVRHTCDNPRCINPEHLIGGTRADNNRDRAERGRSAKHVDSRCKLTAEQIAEIRRRYQKRPKGNPNGVTALSREYGVDAAVIYRYLKGVQPCRNS